MEFGTFGEFALALAAGRLSGGDVVYVARTLYETLPAEERGWLWREALAMRVQLVTDLDIEPPVVVHRRAGPAGGADGADVAAQ